MNNQKQQTVDMQGAVFMLHHLVWVKNQISPTPFDWSDVRIYCDRIFHVQLLSEVDMMDSARGREIVGAIQWRHHDVPKLGDNDLLIKHADWEIQVVRAARVQGAVMENQCKA